MSGRKIYLGDGVYYDFDGHSATLTTEDGHRTTNCIYLEPEVIASLLTALGTDFNKDRLIACVSRAPSPQPEPEPEREDPYIADEVQLSNKACPRHYRYKPGDPRMCKCPEGRCWYDEQVARRREGKLALRSEFFLEPPPE